MEEGEKIEKKLLILAYDFPPYVSVGGLRPYSWYKYLRQFGVYPIVVTRQWENKYGNELDYIAPSVTNETIIEETEYGTIIRTPYKPNLANRILLKYGKKRFRLIRKIVTAFYEYTQFLFFIGPKAGIYRGAKQFLQNNHVDTIIATGEPFVLFKYASQLSSKYNIPWIADYRDIWNFDKRDNISKTFFEKRYLSSVTYLTTVSEFCLKKILTNTNISVKNTVITNGYDESIIESTKNIEQNKHILSFAFVGSIYQWHPIEDILITFAQFYKRHANISLDFYGINNIDRINKCIQQHPELHSFVFIHPRMQNKDLLQELARHNIMLLLNYFSFMGTKIYDYLAIKRSILFCYSNDSQSEKLRLQYFPSKENLQISTHLQEDLIRETHSGIIVQKSQDLLDTLEDLYRTFSTNGRIECKSINVENYSRTNQTKRLAQILKKEIQ